MIIKWISSLVVVLLFVLTLGACTPVTAPADSILQIPAIEEGKFNVAFLYVGPVGDGGWTFAHDVGRKYLEDNMDGKVHTAYMESVPTGGDAERVIRHLANAGFDAVISTAFVYMDQTQTVASEFPDTKFLHVSGFKRNDTNLATLMGGMETMKYLSGLIVGARAHADGSTKIGYIAPFAIPEVIRHINATTMGVRKTCPECVVDIRWIFAWFDPDLENQAAQSLMESGNDIIVSDSDTTGPVLTTADAGKWAVGYDSRNACDVAPEKCLTAPYWNWGPEYVRIVKSMMDGTYKGEDIYFDVNSNSLGLLGFSEDQKPQPGVPADVIPLVQETMAKMASGELNRFSIFTGPIKDNKGKLIVPVGATLTQSDIEGLKDVPGREDCTYCMNWLVEGVNPDAVLP
jgi:basic membrane protein A